MRPVLNSLCDDAWIQYDRYVASFPENVVAPAAPVLYFGNHPEYATSPIRIITVGLNPSNEEFPSANRFRRFPRLRTGSRSEYPLALDEYFSRAPYDWFDSFDAVLEGLHASFKPLRTNRVLHTDLCSPLPTLPTWSNSDLPNSVKEALFTDGLKLWHSLIEQLQPQIVITVVKDEYVQKMGLPPLSRWTSIYTCSCHPRRRAEAIESNSTLFVHGPCVNRPFLTFGRPDKINIGRAIAGTWHG